MGEAGYKDTSGRWLARPSKPLRAFSSSRTGAIAGKRGQADDKQADVSVLFVRESKLLDVSSSVGFVPFDLSPTAEMGRAVCREVTQIDQRQQKRADTRNSELALCTSVRTRSIMVPTTYWAFARQCGHSPCDNVSGFLAREQAKVKRLDELPVIFVDTGMAVVNLFFVFFSVQDPLLTRRWSEQPADPGG